MSRCAGFHRDDLLTVNFRNKLINPSIPVKRRTENHLTTAIYCMNMKYNFRKINTNNGNEHP